MRGSWSDWSISKDPVQRIKAHAWMESRARRLRRNPTAAEKRMWTEIRRGLNAAELAEWQVSKPLPGGYIADFFHVPSRLVVEVDGGYHDTPEQQDWDQTRDATLYFQGIQVIRFSNEAVMTRAKSVLRKIKQKIDNLLGRDKRKIWNKSRPPLEISPDATVKNSNGNSLR